MGYMLPHITIGKARWVAFMENLYAGVNSLQVCQFTIYGLLTERRYPVFCRGLF
jgi:aldehyde:ferredoxin oxidoreductase